MNHNIYNVGYQTNEEYQESMYDVLNDELWRIVESINPKHDNFDKIAIEHLDMDKVRQELCIRIPPMQQAVLRLSYIWAQSLCPIEKPRPECLAQEWDLI